LWTDPTPPYSRRQRLAGPVVVKLSSPDIQHKADVGAVVLGVTGDAAVREAVTRLRALPGHHATGVLVEAMTAPGLELMVSIRRDGAVPVLVVALGGVWVELLDDAVLIPLPVDHAIVRERLYGLRGERRSSRAGAAGPRLMWMACAA
jgi:acetate---CoA ligase (ADP-forming)